MDEKKRHELARMGWEIHAAVEDAYLSDPATRDNSAQWLDQQRLLLADMAVHLLQTSLHAGPIEVEQLKNNLHAI